MPGSLRRTALAGTCPHAVFFRILTLSLILSAGCGREKPETPAVPDPAAPVLLIGVDGLEWNVVLGMIRSGDLPVLRSLMEEGTFGLLETIDPTLSPIIWTSIATGKKPNKHGIRGFVHRSNENPDQDVLYSSGDRRTKAFWNILSDYERRVAAVGWWLTYPVEPIHGVMVAQTNTLEQSNIEYGKNIWKGALRPDIERQVYPTERETEMMAVLAESEAGLAALTEEIFGQFKHPQSALTRRLWENCLWAFRADATYVRIAKGLIGGTDRPELLAVYLGGPDVVGHRFWRYAYPKKFAHRPTDEEIEDLGAIIRSYYKYVDASLGEIFRAYETDVTVIVVSDHGMRADNTEQRFDPDDLPKRVNSGNHANAPPGVIVMAGPRIARAPMAKPIGELRKKDLRPICSVLDVTPTILALMGIPIGQDMDGMVVLSVLDEAMKTEALFRTVPTHDNKEWLATRSTVGVPIRNQEERLEQLRALGYVE